MLLTLLVIYAVLKERYLDYSEVRLLAPFACLFILNVLSIVAKSGLSVRLIYMEFVKYVSVFLCLLVARHCKKDYGKLGKMIVAFFFITCGTSLFVLQTDTQASRILATGIQSAYTDSLSWHNVGDYTFVYSLVIAYPFIALAAKNNKINRLIFIIYSIITVWLVFSSQYTIAILLVFVAVATAFYPRTISVRKALLITGAVVIFVLLFTDLFARFIGIIGNIIGSTEVSIKLNDFVNVLRGNSVTGEDAQGRMELYIYSLRSFSNHFLIGSWYNDGGVYGGHSFIFDTMAKYGILGVAILIWMYKAMYDFIVRPYLKCAGAGFILISYLMALAVSFVNTGFWIDVILLYGSIFIGWVYLSPTLQKETDQIAEVVK